MAVACPTLNHITSEDQCLENFAGLGSMVYVGLKDDLSEKMTLTDNTYSEPKFKPGKGLYRIECKDESNKIESESLGYTKGYKLAGTFIIEAVNKFTSKTGRALNNLNLFFIVPDGEEFQIMYDPIRKVKFDSGGIKSDTGAAAADDRLTTLSPILQPVSYPNLYVDIADIEALIEGAEAP